MTLFKKNSLIFFTTFFLISCENEPYDLFSNLQKINSDSSLFNSIKTISTNDDKTEPVCVIFIYPFNIYTFDDNSEVVDRKIVNNNVEFVNLLGQTEEINGAIGLSYPISSKLEDGSTLIIGDNAELKETIEACIETEIIGNCNDILEEENCIWTINSLTENKEYNNSLLDFYQDGTGIFYHEGDAYRTSWVSLFIEEKLHINIHLEGESQTAQDWNFDWEATIIDDATIEITNQDKKHTIKKQCAVENSCDYVEFRKCALKGFDDKAEFMLDEYKECIVSLQENINTGAEVTFFNTYSDAEEEQNILGSSAYTNTTNPQLVFAKIKNSETNVSKIIRIVLFVEACNNTDAS